MNDRLAVVSIIVLTVLAMIIASGCKGAVFEATNLIINPEEVQTGQSVSISVDVANTGGAEGTYSVILKIDGIKTDEQNITVGPEATGQGTFTVAKEEAGSYKIDVNGLTATLTVLEPPKVAEFKVSNLMVSPKEVVTGESCTVTVDVTNIGEVEDDYEIVLNVSWSSSLHPNLLDHYREKKNATIAAGATETVSFLLLELELEDYTINIDGLSSTFAVMAPPGGLRFYATVRGIEIGAAVATGPLLRGDRYSRTLAREFSMVTPEDAMKFEPLHPERDRYDFSAADAIVDFAHAHDMRVRGHTLVWHLQLPTWLTEGSWTRDELIDILREHITTVVGRYRGRVAVWDVVNEAVSEDGSLRDTIWLEGIGPDYIDMAFAWAHEADPDAKLFYNDYGGEGPGPKSDAIYALAQDLLGRGVPIDGIGLQMHVSLDWFPAPQDIATNMKRLATLGLDVHVTEMDVRIEGDPTEENLAAQARIYADILKACLSAENCSAFVLWGFVDSHSWIPYFFSGWGAALIFDESYRPKPAYDALIDVLSGD